MGYKHTYFNQHERNHIWRNINSDEDVQMCINGCLNALKIYEGVPIKNRIREDKEGVERQLGELEIALERIDKFPKQFTFTQEDVKCLKEQFLDFEEKLEQLDMQRVSWD